MSENAPSMCPLCHDVHIGEFYADKVREYFRCSVCQLIFVPSAWHLSQADEKAVYDYHENSPDDPRYRSFLSRLFDPVSLRLQPGSSGLDFGSGPGPTLSVMFMEQGHQVAIYDPFYAPDAGPLTQLYDFVTATEVVEHLYDPATDLNSMWSCVKPGGLLAIMTRPAPAAENFAAWHYKNDPTHVSFFSPATFAWLAEQWDAELTSCGDQVSILQRR